MGRRKKTVSYSVDTTVDVDVDISDVLDHLDDEDLLAEVKARGYKVLDHLNDKDLLAEVKARGYEIHDPDRQLDKTDAQALVAALTNVAPSTKWWWSHLNSVIEKLYKMA